MKARWIGIIGGLLLVGAIALAGVGIAQARGTNGGFGFWGIGQGTTQQTRTGWGPMMGGGPNGTYSPGNMMGGNGSTGSYGPGNMMGGNGGMMGGYGAAQNPANVAPVTGNAVTIQNFAFQPANLQVKVGTTVTWTNNDTAPHTVTFRDGSLTSSALLQKGQSYSYTFTKVGTFSYYCDVHEAMTGQVTVTA